MDEDRAFLAQVFAYLAIVAIVLWAYHMGRESADSEWSRRLVPIGAFGQAPRGDRRPGRPEGADA